MLPKFPATPLIADLDPLIITSPTIRCGTTLLQRLLCSSKQALIYGELTGQDLDFFLNIYIFKVQQYRYHQPRYATSLERVLQGEVDDWIPDLMPDIDQYLASMGQAAFAGITYCRDSAIQSGRTYWGFKYPSWKPAMLNILREIMPKSRFIYIYRDVVESLRSAKAQLAITSIQEVEEFCTAWTTSLEYFLSLESDPRVLIMRYEDLISEPEAALQGLAEFTGVTDINPAVLQRKINAWAGEDYLAQARDGYTPPGELDDVEKRIIIDKTAILRGRLYADSPIESLPIKQVDS